MSRTPNLTIWSVYHGKQPLESFKLERELDGELRYEADEPEAPAKPTAVDGTHVLFLDVEGAIIGQVPRVSVPPDLEAVIVGGNRAFVRTGGAGFREVRSVSASMR